MNAVNSLRGAGRKTQEFVLAAIVIVMCVGGMISATLWYVHDIMAFALGILHFFGIARGWVMPGRPLNPWS